MREPLSHSFRPSLMNDSYSFSCWTNSVYSSSSLRKLHVKSVIQIFCKVKFLSLLGFLAVLDIYGIICKGITFDIFFVCFPGFLLLWTMATPFTLSFGFDYSKDFVPKLLASHVWLIWFKSFSEKNICIEEKNSRKIDLEVISLP